MGSTGPRMFVPPQTDPLDPEVHSLVFRMADSIGTNMSRRLEENDKTGVGHNMIFDSYWPGGTRNTAWWKNVTGLLTEVASARIATPVYIDPGELRGGGKGFPEYGRRSNFPSPWPGGWWRLRDIVEYEMVATWAYLEAIAEDRTHILTNVDRMAREAIDKGSTEAPFAFIIPPDQHDEVAARKMVALLLRHGVEIEQAKDAFKVGYATYPAGTVVIPAAQPYRPFLLTMLRSQRYPEVRPSVNGPIIEPYDVASWSLPLTMGVDVVETPEPVIGTFEPITSADWPRQAIIVDDPAGTIIPAGADSLYTAVNRLLADGRTVARIPETGDVWIDHTTVDRSTVAALADELELPTIEVAEAPEATRAISAQRIGLFKPWVASMDEGWTRWVLEQYDFPMVNIANEQIRSGEFIDTVDVLLFPDVEAGIISKGVPGDSYWGRFVPLPPEYSGGIDEWKSDDDASQDGKKSKQVTAAKPTKGGERIKKWVEGGGTVVALDSSADYFIDLFELPVEGCRCRREARSSSAPDRRSGSRSTPPTPWVGACARKRQSTSPTHRPSRPASQTRASTAMSSHATRTTSVTSCSAATSKAVRSSSAARRWSSTRSVKAASCSSVSAPSTAASRCGPSSCFSMRSTRSTASSEPPRGGCLRSSRPAPHAAGGLSSPFP